MKLVFINGEGGAQGIIEVKIAGMTDRAADKVIEQGSIAAGSLRVVFEQGHDKIRELPVKLRVVFAGWDGQVRKRFFC
jgi:GrpB-like predicted nucleotidyltransferase (UPF0157 family)